MRELIARVKALRIAIPYLLLILAAMTGLAVYITGRFG